MKKLMVALFALGMSSSAYAESSIETTVGVERNLDTEINKLFFGPSITSGDFTLSTTVNMVDTTADNMKFNMSSADVDLNYSVTPIIDIYMENDLDADFKQTDTTVGIAVKF
jgi:hypothetical protein